MIKEAVRRIQGALRATRRTSGHANTGERERTKRQLLHAGSSRWLGAPEPDPGVTTDRDHQITVRVEGDVVDAVRVFVNRGNLRREPRPVQSHIDVPRLDRPVVMTLKAALRSTVIGSTGCCPAITAARLAAGVTCEGTG